MRKSLDQLKKSALQELEKASTMAAFTELDIKYLGRNGLLTQKLRSIKDLPENERKEVGQLMNKAKIELEENFKAKRDELEKATLENELKKEFFDITLPGTTHEIGHARGIASAGATPPCGGVALGTIHILSQLQEEAEKIFSQMGFSIMDGPEIESEYYNFEGLNIPKDHPARDMQDTFFIKKKRHDHHGQLVLRTHTSPVQVRTMEKYGAPLRVIVPGRVFRNEATDARHEHTFHQIEGILIDKDISIASLKGIMTEFLSRLFKKPVKVRFRPGYFPFVEPGLELDFSCLLCGEKGCRVCKNTGWMEFMGSGMMHENVLKAGGIDSKIYQGWAFGFGLERLAMMKYDINDIRLFQSGDLRFIKQF